MTVKRFDFSLLGGRILEEFMSTKKQLSFNEKLWKSQAGTSSTGIRGVSLFAGAGGMDVGFESAGVNVVKANEIAPFACETYRANHPGTLLLQGDVNDFVESFEEGEADIVFGGPPCQGFSVAGKMNPEDERSQLIWSYLNVVAKVNPRVFVMENVKALASLEKWRGVRERYIQRAEELGYCCHFYVLNSADFGVSQKRERVFFIGSKTPYEYEALKAALDAEKSEPIKLRELFLSLPPIGTEGNEHTCKAKITIAANPVMRKSPYAGMIFNGMGRPLNLDAVSSTLPASMGGNKTPIIDEVILQDPTANDWIKEYHSKLWNKEVKPIFGDAPSRLRRISLTEAAAIQSFPRDYQWRGQKSAIYTQIGNAVPCKLAEGVANAVIKFFGL